MIEASEHVLATAKHLLRPGSDAEPSALRLPPAIPLARPAVSAGDEDRARPWERSDDLRPVCECIVENSW